MAKDFARAFYDSPAWKRTRRAYASSVGGLCERCIRSGLYTPGVIVHHINHLTPENINNPDIALGWSNLELVCRECHAEIHEADIKRRAPRRYCVDKTGRVVPI
jgi:5-methylcytosine-specific restriction endonuclease McrA